MANIKISDLPLASALDGTEELPVVQGGTTKKVHIGSIQTSTQIQTGAIDFIQLTDVPNTYAGASLKTVRVNAGEAGLEFATATTVLTDGDYGDVAVSSSGTALTVQSVGGRTFTTADAGTNAVFGWDDGASAYENLTAAEVQAIIGPLPVAYGGTGQTTEAEALGEMIQALTEDTTPNTATDYLVTYSSSSDTGRKVKVQNVQAGRVVLTAARVYYVRKDGNDANTGLANNAGGAFLTIGKAMQEVGKLDVGIGNYASYLAEIRVGAGTYSELVDLPQLTGAGLYSDNITGAEAIAILHADSGVASDVVIEGPSGQCIRCVRNWGWLLTALTFQPAAGQGGAKMIQVVEESILRLGNCIINGGGPAGADRAFTGVAVYDHSELYVVDTAINFKGNFTYAVDCQYYSIWYSFGRDVQLIGTVDCNGAFVAIGQYAEYYGNDVIEGGGDLLVGNAWLFQAHCGNITTDIGPGGSAWDFSVTGMGGRFGSATPGTLALGGTVNGLRLVNDAVTYANRPIVPQAGMIIPITDGQTTTPGTVVSSGGGASPVPIYWNGTDWIALAGTGTSHSSGTTIFSTTAVSAGGTLGVGYQMSATANLGIFYGSGAPSLSAAQGSLYMRTDGSSSNSRMYVNTTSTNVWTAIITAT